MTQPTQQPTHFHAYRWAGARATFDQEVDRKRESPGFMSCEVTPIEVAHWLLRPGRMVKGTFDTPKEAVAWIEEQLNDLAPSMSSAQDRRPERLESTVAYAEETLGWGGDLSFGWYTHGGFAKVDMIGCSPNLGTVNLPCPLRR